MAQTIVGLFDTASEAEEAVNELVNNGFERDNIDISHGRVGDDGTIELTDEAAAWNENEHTTFGESVSNFFKSLFNGKDEAFKYSEVARRHAVVSVYTASIEQAEEAADILDECGAMDVEERANMYTNTITTGGTTIGHSLPGNTQRDLGTVNDRVTQYSDKQNEDRIQTGTFQDPVGGDLDDRVSSFADTTSTINDIDNENDNTGSAGKTETTTQPGRWRSRIFESSDEDSVRWQHYRDKYPRENND